ncbi:MAG TPA: peptidoglycan-binding protein [Arachnia sp.]|nr:peptidoglycan-binding protein [Arachnia sp.]HMT87472.1 peptidoglycan-binding protein [Arachnia sp.]
MRRCQRCGRQAPSGVCPDCEKVLGPGWGIESDDTMIEPTAPIPVAPPPYAPQAPGGWVPPAPDPSIYRSEWSQPTGFGSSSSGPPEFMPPAAGEPPVEGFLSDALLQSESRKGPGAAGFVVVAVVAVAVLAAGALFASRMLGPDEALTAEMASPAPYETPTAMPTPTATPTTPTVPTTTAPTSTPAPEATFSEAPAPEATVTVTATATATATTTVVQVEPAERGDTSGTASSRPATVRASEPPAQRFEQFYPLGFGDQGYIVEALQRILTWRGIRTYVDGDFGSATERSVRQWQANQGLSVTGVVDDTTWGSLLPKLEKGSSGDAVIAMQQVLWERGYPLEVDGDFGPQTDRVVREFQTARGLEVDGIVGPRTWAALLA